MGAAWPATEVALMLVSPWWEDFLWLRRICRSENWILYWVKGYREAAPIIREHAVAVVIGEPEVEGDGKWQELLEGGGDDRRPRVLVTLSDPDYSTCAAIAERGAFDVLVKPLDRANVVRAVRLAWANCQAERERSRVQPPQQ